MDNNQNENINENEETEEGSKKSSKSLVIGLSLIFISLVLFAIITINSSNNNQPKIGNNTSSQVKIDRQEQLAAEQNETEGATAAEYISIIVSGTTITIDDKEYTAKEAAKKIADMGSDYGAVLTDNNASLITMTDLFQALNDKGVIYRLA